LDGKLRQMARSQVVIHRPPRAQQQRGTKDVSVLGQFDPPRRRPCAPRGARHRAHRTGRGAAAGARVVL